MYNSKNVPNLPKFSHKLKLGGLSITNSYIQFIILRGFFKDSENSVV